MNSNLEVFRKSWLNPEKRIDKKDKQKEGK
jgi:hypothetical protein